jgi:hypothetical protein
MLTRDDAGALVLRRIAADCADLPPEDELIVVDDATIERAWGWVFFYTSKLWQETQDIAYALAGNAPLLVDRQTGATHVLGTAHSVEEYMRAFEETGDPYAFQR